MRTPNLGYRGDGTPESLTALGMTFWRRWGAKTRIIFILAYFIIWAALVFTRAGEIVLTAFGHSAIVAFITSALALATCLLFRPQPGRATNRDVAARNY